MINILTPFLFNRVKQLIHVLDASFWAPLASQNGKTLSINISGMMACQFQVLNNELQLDSISQPSTIQPKTNCHINGSLSKLLDLLFIDKQWRPGNGIACQGDIALAKTLFECFHRADLDWGGVFAQCVPAPLINLMSPFATSLQQEWQNWRTNRATDLNHYLIDEADLVPSQHAVRYLEAQVVALKAQSDQLHKRLQACQQQLSSCL